MMMAKVCLLEGLPDISLYSDSSFIFTILFKNALLHGTQKWPLFLRCVQPMCCVHVCLGCKIQGICKVLIQILVTRLVNFDTSLSDQELEKAWKEEKPT